jgi:hypothetical protein
MIIKAFDLIKIVLTWIISCTIDLYVAISLYKNYNENCYTSEYEYLLYIGLIMSIVCGFTSIIGVSFSLSWLTSVISWNNVKNDHTKKYIALIFVEPIIIVFWQCCILVIGVIIHEDGKYRMSVTTRKQKTNILMFQYFQFICRIISSTLKFLLISGVVIYSQFHDLTYSNFKTTGLINYYDVSHFDQFKNYMMNWSNFSVCSSDGMGSCFSYESCPYGDKCSSCISPEAGPICGVYNTIIGIVPDPNNDDCTHMGNIYSEFGYKLTFHHSENVTIDKYGNILDKKFNTVKFQQSCKTINQTGSCTYNKQLYCDAQQYCPNLFIINLRNYCYDYNTNLFNACSCKSSFLVINSTYIDLEQLFYDECIN